MTQSCPNISLTHLLEEEILKIYQSKISLYYPDNIRKKVSKIYRELNIIRLLTVLIHSFSGSNSARKWLLLAKNIISKGNKHYIASGLSKKNELQLADITTYESALKKTSWKSFDVFIRGINMCRVVTLNNQDFRRSK
ncbi:hypothetical protein BpHYR1_030663, partial [Brachionus plicatilis]